METVSGGTRACPHCGGEIKAAAKVCKHCKELVTAGPHPVDERAAPADFAGVLGDLRAFLTGRKVLRDEQFPPLLAQRPGADAAVILGHLPTGGFVTEMHVESLREAFRREQLSKAAAVLHAASEQGLLTPTHVEQALVGYRAVVFQRALGEHLASAGFLTPSQAIELRLGAGSTPEAQGRVTVLWNRVRTDPAIWRPLLAGPGAAIVWAVVLAAIARRFGSAGDWLHTFTFAPIAVVLAIVWKTARPAEKVAWGACTALCIPVGFLIAGLTGLLDGPSSRPELIPHCTMDGAGRGTCVFTNLGLDTVNSCGQIVATCTPTRGEAQSRDSEPMCSGSVAPGRTRRLAFDVAAFDQIRDRAVPTYGDWRNFCEFDWSPR